MVSATPFFVYKAGTVLFAFLFALLAQRVVEGSSRPLRQREERQEGSLPAAQPPHSCRAEQCAAAAPRPAWRAPGALRLRGSLGLELVEQTARRGHCFPYKDGQGRSDSPSLASESCQGTEWPGIIHSFIHSFIPLTGISQVPAPC